MEKAREFQKNIYFCFIDYAKAFNCVDHNKLWELVQEMGTPDHLTCLLRNLYAGQEIAVITGHVSSIESRVEPHGSSCKEKGHRVPPQLEINPDSPTPGPMRHQ